MISSIDKFLNSNDNFLNSIDKFLNSNDNFTWDNYMEIIC